LVSVGPSVMFSNNKMIEENRLRLYFAFVSELVSTLFWGCGCACA
jgi:hypothetical protein